MHNAFTVGIPPVAILAGSLFNRQEVNNLRTEMNSRFDKVDAKFESVQRVIDGRLENIQRDMREFYGEQARHDVRITNLEQK